MFLDPKISHMNTTKACYPSLFSALISTLFSDPAKNHNIVNLLFKVAIYCGSTLMRTILVFFGPCLWAHVLLVFGISRNAQPAAGGHVFFYTF